MDEMYDSFLFKEEPRVGSDEEGALYDRDLVFSCNSLSDDCLRLEQEGRALDEFIRILPKEAREYLQYRLQVTPLTPARRLAYTSVKNTEMQKHLRHVLLLMATVISKGDPHALILDTAEDLQVARSMSIQDPYEAVRMRKRRRKAANLGSQEDLATNLLNNLSIAYKHNCKKRSEKKRILSIAAPAITYAEGRRLFECGPTQFSEAKKHAAKFGPFANVKNSELKDEKVLETFAKKYSECDKETAWQHFQKKYPETAARIGREGLLARIRFYGDSTDSVDDMFMDLDHEEEPLPNILKGL